MIIIKQILPAMLLPIPSIKGYNILRETIHQHPVTGLLHGLFMPIATIGFYMLIFGISGLYFDNRVIRWDEIINKAEKITIAISHFIFGMIWIGYTTYSLYLGTLTILFYWVIIK